MKDKYNREIDYMRISITDRCNLRCKYCMPNDVEFAPTYEILTYKEIEKICIVAAKVGIKKLKITGGEPLVRPKCAELVKTLKVIPGIEQVTLTTNGILLMEHIDELIKYGLDAVNISLDTVKAQVYREITKKDELKKVMDGIDCAVSRGLKTKVNVVLQEGVNEKEWYDLIQLAKNKPIDVRFIEMMPIGYGKKYNTIFNENIIEKIKGIYEDITYDHRKHGNGPAIYYNIPGFKGSIGFISAVHGKFCNDCNRIRLTSTGILKPCLCYSDGVDLKQILREKFQCEGNDNKFSKKDYIEQQLLKAITKAISIKPKSHCFDNLKDITENNKMVQIGG